MNKIKNNLPIIPIEQFQKKVLDWYKIHARALPWRETKNPYHVWISEIMLQQTRTDTVRDYFLSFIKRFPGISELASADSADILRYWQGLGYYRRAINIHKAARIIQKDFQGIFPVNYDQILRLPGIGSYTAGAIASIAFEQDLPAVDGNVKRVISRIFFLTEDVDKIKVTKKITEIVKQIISKKQPGDFNQALMEIGATLCLPKKPNCQHCPVKPDCLAAQKGKQELLPIKRRKKTPKTFTIEVAIVKNKNQLLLVKRPDHGILANMWGLPAIINPSEPPTGIYILKQVEKKFHLTLKEKPLFIKEMKHIFTHQIWKMHLYLLYTKENDILSEPYYSWLKKEELENFPIPEAFQKCLRAYSEYCLV